MLLVQSGGGSKPAFPQDREEWPCELKLVAEVTKHYNSAASVISCHEECGGLTLAGRYMPTKDALSLPFSAV